MLRLGFACVWDPEPRATWSHTPWSLREALGARPDVVDLVDVGLAPPRLLRRALQAAALRRRDGRWTSAWEHLPAWERWSQRSIASRTRRARCDAVVEIQDLAVLDVPYYPYQDLSYDALLREQERDPVRLRHFFGHLDRDTLRRRRDRQRAVYEQAGGVLAMSQWLAAALVELSGLAPERVHVVHPGIETVEPGRGGVARREPPRRRLLFVGSNFATKGGDVVVAAHGILRREHDPRLTLTVVGPRSWPEPGPPPPGVDFLGHQPLARVARLYDAHDLLVMPSRLEGFGKVFVEALARGLPCIGRDAFAMTELITPGVDGALVADDDPVALAESIVAVLDDDALYASCAARAGEVAAHFSWSRAARDVLAVVGAGAPSRDPA